MRYTIIAICVVWCGLCGAVPLRVESAHDSILVELSLPTPRTAEIRLAGRRYVEVTSPGIASGGSSGSPSLPRLSRLVAVPPGRIAVLGDVTADDESLPTRFPPSPVPELRRHCGGSRNEARPSPAAYAAAHATPPARLSVTSHAGPVRAALLTLSPVRTTADGGLVFSRRLTARIHFVPAESPAPPVGSGVDDATARLLHAVFLNPAAAVAAISPSPRRRDLILAGPAYAEPIGLLVRFKRAQGREVDLRILARPTVDQVQGILREAYASSSPPSHTLLVGSIDEIPSFRRGSYWSDYPYTLLDAGNYPDLSIARLPAHGPDELGRAIAKIIRRESAPRDDWAFLVTSGYETGWCHVNLKFIMEKLFPGSSVPIRVTKLYASEGAKTDRVIEGYNANPNVIVYDGHGNAQGMTEIPLLIDHLQRLRNTVPPLVFDIACLNSYWPTSGASARNFADSILTVADHGPAGILAASSNSGGHDLFRHVFRGAIYDEQSPSEPHHRLNEVGTAVLYGKLKYLEQLHGSADALADNQMFYYHGDPASTVFTEAGL